jgi:CheY-like chemotaxis protein
LGYVVIRTASAEAALGALADDRPIDIIFSDIMMPGKMNGLDLAREALRRRPGLSVLLTSGYVEAAMSQASGENIRVSANPTISKRSPGPSKRCLTAFKEFCSG